MGLVGAPFIKVSNTRFLLILYLGLFSSHFFGQEIKDEKQNGNGIYLLPSQLIFPEILLTYEHFIASKMSISFSLGYKIPIAQEGNIKVYGFGLFAEYDYYYMLNKYSNGIYTSIAPTFYPNSKNQFFLQPELFYRYYWFTDKNLIFDTDGKDFYNAIRSEKNHVIGLKLLVGRNTLIELKNNITINIRVYGGVGFRYKTYIYESKNSKTYDQYGEETIVPYKIEKGVFYFPAPQIGVKIGLSKIR